MSARHAWTLIALLSATAVRADSGLDDRTYLTLRGGGSWLHQTELTFANPRVTSLTGRDDHDSDGLVALAAGRKLEGGYRLELEYANRSESRFRVDTAGGSVVGATDFNGVNSLRVYNSSIMGNVFYDFRTKTRLKPYLQLGLGLYENRTTAFQVFQNPTNTGPFKSGASWPEREESGLAWSLGGGGSFALGSVWALDLGWRYVDLGEFDTGTDIVNGDERFSADLRGHELYLGARWGF